MTVRRIKTACPAKADPIHGLIRTHAATLTARAHAEAAVSKLEAKLQRQKELGGADLLRATAPFEIETHSGQRIWFDTLDQFSDYLARNFNPASETAESLLGPKGKERVNVARSALFEIGLRAALKADGALRKEQKKRGYIQAIRARATAQEREKRALLMLCGTHAHSVPGAQKLSIYLTNQIKRFVTDESGKAVAHAVVGLSGALGLMFAGIKPNDADHAMTILQPRRKRATRAARVIEIRKAA
jgi:hypothetical protein